MQRYRLLVVSIVSLPVETDPVNVPQLKQLGEELASVPDWHRLGILLGIREGTLKQIGTDFSHHGVGRCMNEVLIHLLHNGSNVTWESVCSALDKMDKKNLAKQIRQKHTKLEYVQLQKTKG